MPSFSQLKAYFALRNTACFCFSRIYSEVRSYRETERERVPFPLVHDSDGPNCWAWTGSKARVKFPHWVFIVCARCVHMFILCVCCVVCAHAHVVSVLWGRQGPKYLGHLPLLFPGHQQQSSWDRNWNPHGTPALQIVALPAIPQCRLLAFKTSPAFEETYNS